VEQQAQPLDRAALNGWIESVVQHVDAWMSDENLDSGARWNEAIALPPKPLRRAMVRPVTDGMPAADRQLLLRDLSANRTVRTAVRGARKVIQVPTLGQML
jgi:hypothetical protein